MLLDDLLAVFWGDIGFHWQRSSMSDIKLLCKYPTLTICKYPICIKLLAFAVAVQLLLR